jgi:hypothetical protein
MEMKITRRLPLEDGSNESAFEKCIDDLVKNRCTEVVASPPIGVVHYSQSMRFVLQRCSPPCGDASTLQVEIHERGVPVPTYVGYLQPSSSTKCGYRVRYGFGADWGGGDGYRPIVTSCIKTLDWPVGKILSDSWPHSITEMSDEIFPGGSTGRINERGYVYVLRSYRSGWLRNPFLAIEMYRKASRIKFPVGVAYLLPNAGTWTDLGPGFQLIHVHSVPKFQLSGWLRQFQGHGRRMWDFLLKHIAPFTVQYIFASTNGFERAECDVKRGEYYSAMIQETRDHYPDTVKDVERKWARGTLKGVCIGANITAEGDVG